MKYKNNVNTVVADEIKAYKDNIYIMMNNIKLNNLHHHLNILHIWVQKQKIYYY